MGKIEISSALYQFSHGKAPRGLGHWAFEFADSPEAWIAKGELSFAEAAKAAKAEARRRGLSMARVAP